MKQNNAGLIIAANKMIRAYTTINAKIINGESLSNEDLFTIRLLLNARVSELSDQVYQIIHLEHLEGEDNNASESNDN